MISVQIKDLLHELDALLVSHFYQKDEVVELAELTGDSLELSKKASLSKKNLVVFCGVGFMGQSVKILSPNKRVIMPKVACCSMARMISSDYFDNSIAYLNSLGIKDIFPITYINSNADVKAKVGQMGGVVCTSSNARTIFNYAKTHNKKIFFLPDKCLGLNLAFMDNKKASVIGESTEEQIIDSDVICYNGFCSVHQLFDVSDIEFYKDTYSDILIITHPECKPEVVAKSDFVGSTSQIINFVKSLPASQRVAIGTEFNLVNRLRTPYNGENNTFILSSSKPECPTMNETTLQDLLNVLTEYKHSLNNGNLIPNEITIDATTIIYAKKALDKMLELSI